GNKDILVLHWVQTRSIIVPHLRSIFQRDEYVIRAVVRGIRIARDRILRNRNQGRGVWNIAVRNAADARALAGHIVRVDLLRVDVPVPVQVGVIADAACAIVDRILLAVYLHWGEVVPVAGRKREITACKPAAAGDLPTADESVQ